MPTPLRCLPKPKCTTVVHDSICILNRFSDLAGALCLALWLNEMPHVPGKGQTSLIRGSVRRLLSLQLPPLVYKTCH